MARGLSTSADQVFRAVVVVDWDSGAPGSTFAYGPYTRRQDASRMVTREVRSWKYRSGSASGWVESADVEWKPVDK